MYRIKEWAQNIEPGALGLVTRHSLLRFSGGPFSDCVAEKHVAG
jgi:hypothetical protein